MNVLDLESSDACICPKRLLLGHGDNVDADWRSLPIHTLGKDFGVGVGVRLFVGARSEAPRTVNQKNM